MHDWTAFFMTNWRSFDRLEVSCSFIRYGSSMNYENMAEYAGHISNVETICWAISGSTNDLKTKWKYLMGNYSSFEISMHPWKQKRGKIQSWDFNILCSAIKLFTCIAHVCKFSISRYSLCLLVRAADRIAAMWNAIGKWKIDYPLLGDFLLFFYLFFFFQLNKIC